MPAPTSINDLSTTAASNGPEGATSVREIDDYFRAHASFIAQLRDEKVTESDLAASTGAGMIGFSHSETYAAGTLGAKGKQLISVKDAPFNAVGDGVTDDTAAIQAAINATDGSGGGLFFPHGTYAIASGLVVSGSWRRLFSTALAVGLPGAQIKAITRGITNLDANMQTVAIENLSFYGFAASTITGSITSGSTQLTVSSPTSWQAGDVLTVAGAGASGGDLYTTVASILGNVFTLSTTAGTSVTDAAVTYDPRGDSGSVGVHLRQNSGAIQQDDARIINCWFAGFGEAAIKAPKLQGCHIVNSTFEFSGAGIKCYSADDSAIFYQNIIKGNRFYRCLRGVWLHRGTAGSTYATDVKWNVIAQNIFDFCGSYAIPASNQAAVSLSSYAGFNTIDGNQFANQMCDDVYINLGLGNTLTGNQFHRTGKAAIRLVDADDTIISSYMIDNANNGILTHGVTHSAIELSESQGVRISDGRVYQFGSAAMLRAINALNNSSVIVRSSSLANGTSAAAVADGSSSIFYADTVSGSWTPVVASSAGTGPTTYTASGTYKIVGDTVFITCDIQVTAKGAGMSGYVTITGLPFTPIGDSFLSMVPRLYFVNYTAGDQFILTTTGGSAIFPKKISANNPAVELDSSYITDNTQIAFQGHFKISTTGTINVNN